MIMGGYWAYVWPAYSIATMVLLGLLLVVLGRLSRNRKMLKSLEVRHPQQSKDEPQIVEKENRC